MAMGAVVRNPYLKLLEELAQVAEAALQLPLLLHHPRHRSCRLVLLHILHSNT